MTGARDEQLCCSISSRALICGTVGTSVLAASTRASLVMRLCRVAGAACGGRSGQAAGRTSKTG
jgi:hypothetical protein